MTEITDPKEIRRYVRESLRRAFQDWDAFDEARKKLRHMSIERHGAGPLRDVQVVLAEDGRTVLLYADYENDEPLAASFVLTQATTEDDFDPEFYVEECERDRPWEA